MSVRGLQGVPFASSTLVNFDSPPEGCFQRRPSPNLAAGLRSPLMGVDPGPAPPLALPEPLDPLESCCSARPLPADSLPTTAASAGLVADPTHPKACPAFVALRRDSATCLTRSVLVVSLHLDGFLRAWSASLLHPAASHGVRRVWRAAASSPNTRVRTFFRRRLPRDARPFEAFPSSTAGPCHHGLLPSCRYCSGRHSCTPGGVLHVHRRVFHAAPHFRKPRSFDPWFLSRERAPACLASPVSLQPVPGCVTTRDSVRRGFVASTGMSRLPRRALRRLPLSTRPSA